MANVRPVVCIDLKDWYRPSELAKLLQISKQAMNSRIRSGSITAWHIKQLNLTLVKKP